MEQTHSVIPNDEKEFPAGEAKSGSSDKILKLDVSLTLWVILFVFGGGLLALYYAGIGYFPEVSWQDALTFMALMTIIGGSLLVAYSFLLLVPGAIWSEFLIYDKHLNHVLMMGHRRWEPCVWAVTKRVLFPFALFMAFCHFLLYQDNPWQIVPLGAGASLLAVTELLLRNLQKGFTFWQHPKVQEGQAPAADREPDPPSLNRHRLFVGASHLPLLGVFIVRVEGYQTLGTWVWVSALLPLAAFVGLLAHGRIEVRNWQRACGETVKDPDHFSLLCRAALAFGSAALLSLMALCFFHRIYKGGPADVPGQVPWSLLVLCTVVVIMTNLVVSVLFRYHRRAALFASFLAALLLLGAGQILGTNPDNTLPARIMERFGFGGPSLRLVVTERGGRLLCQQGVAVEFEPAAQERDGSLATPQEMPSGIKKAANGESKEKGPLARADHLVILSRLGSQVLLGLNSDQQFKKGLPVEKRERTIVLPKDEILSWSTLGKSKLPPLQDKCKPPAPEMPSLPSSGERTGKSPR
jgi:hypothetical protein